MRKKALSPAARREEAQRLSASGLCSARAACRILELARSTYRYRGRPPTEQEEALHRRLQELSERHPRYGYRRICVLLRREGGAVNAKRVYRLYKLAGLTMRHKPPRRRVAAMVRDDRTPATGANQVWAMDWMYDQLFDGRRIWVLTSWTPGAGSARCCESAEPPQPWR